tara:strand:+ start:105 stop:1004 length:900 start_codon:yes stop_codon:yes gene_type:complete
MKKFIILSLIFIVGCSKLPWKKEVQDSEATFDEEPNVEIEQLYGLHNKQGAEIVSHKTDIDYLESKIDSIGSDVAFIKDVLNNLQDQMRKNQSTDNASEDTTEVSVVSEMAQLQMKVKLNKDRVDRYTMFFDSVRFDMNQRYVILDNEVSTLRKSLVEYISANDQDLNTTVKKISDQEFRNRYSKYYKNYINEDYDMSIRGFKELLASNKSHDLSENCQYWMGEAYFATGQYDVALAEFKKVFGYPNEKKEDDAQLKIGICYIKLENNDRAKKELQNYIDQYPQGEFIDKAKSYLLQLD